MEQESKEVVLTYETLYEMLRKEKTRQGLQKIESNFVRDLLTYLQEKQQSYDDAISKEDIFSQNEREKLATQIRNAKKLTRDLYDIRERKIINMAINYSRTNSHIVDTEHLLPHESEFFNSIKTLLNMNRESILKKILSLRAPEVSTDLPEPTATSVPQASMKTESSEKKTEQSFSAPVSTHTPKQNPGKKNISFLEDVDQFVGEELELYGPYKAQEQAELPQEVADVLIRQGKAAQL